MKVLKFFLFIIFISLFVLFASLSHVLFFANKQLLNQILLKLVQGTNTMGVWIFSLRPTKKIIFPTLPHGPKLFVGNHLSYLDVIILSHHIPMNFVTSMDMKETLGLGHLCRLANCIFAHRHNKFKVLKDIKAMEFYLQQGFSLGLFPEAKSGDGSQVFPLHTALLKCAISTNTPIVPFVLNYQSIDGHPVNLNNKDLLFWYGNRSFLDHLWNFLGTKRTVYDLKFFDPIIPEGKSREEIHQTLEKIFQHNYHKIS